MDLTSFSFLKLYPGDHNVPIDLAARPNKYLKSTKGNGLKKSFFSKILGVKKHYNIFLPPEYKKSDKRYPVLYYFAAMKMNGSTLIWITAGVAAPYNTWRMN